MTMDDRINEQAAAWHSRQQDDAMDWQGFTAWLEADPRHREAYDELALIDSDLDEYRDILVRTDAAVGSGQANHSRSSRLPRWSGWAAGAAAAGLAAVLVLQPGPQSVPIQDYQSGPRQTTEVALADGTNITLAPSSHLTVDGQQLALEGTGYFDVPHNPGRTLSVRAGDFHVTDIGTRFSVGNEADAVHVEVAEGSLTVHSSRLAKPISLSTGKGLHADKASGTVRLSNVSPGSVAAWRTGKLQFDQVPLALVARDVTRYSGQRVTVDPAVADRVFSGVIAIDEGASPGASLAQIMALDAQPVDGGVRLEPRR